MVQLSFMYEVKKPTSDDLILECAKVSVESGLGRWVSRSQIARFCGRKVTPSLIDKIEKLVEAGKLEKDSFELRNKAVGYAYAIPLEGAK